MIFTEAQKEILNVTKMSKIIYKKMFKSHNQLGYTTQGDIYGYHIHIASDAPDQDIKDITLLHEAGHIFFHHIDVSIKNELKNIEVLLKDHNKTLNNLSKCYGGPLKFLNLCMDLEVNSKVLSSKNIKKMEDIFPLCTPEKYKVPILDKFFEYYEPLIEKIPNYQNDSNSDDFNNNQSSDQSENNNNRNNDNMNFPGNNPYNNNDDDIPPMDNSVPNPEDKSSNNSSNNKESPNNKEPFNNDLNWVLNDTVGLSEEIKDSIKKENYKPNNKIIENDFNAKQEEIIYSQELLKRINDCISSAGIAHNDNGEEIQIVENNDKNIEKFIKDILGDNLVVRQDALRHYNRGTRDRSNGILYNSLRRRVEFSRKKLCIIIDVSGSMNTHSITTAISSLKNCYQTLDPGSMVYTWDTSLIQSFKINEIPNSIKQGNGTELASALTYAALNKFTDVVIYSDFDTYNYSKFNKELEKTKFNIYPIWVKSYNIDVANSKNIFPGLFKKGKYLFVS